MKARWTAALMALCGVEARELPEGMVRRQVEKLVRRAGVNPDRLVILEFSDGRYGGFLWQCFGLRAMGLSSALLRSGNLRALARVVRHEMEHYRRRHWLRGAAANLARELGSRLERRGEAWLKTIEDEAEGHDRD